MVILVPLPVEKSDSENSGLETVRSPRGRTKPYSQTLPLSRLSTYERVTDQFSDYGVLIQGGLALLPSNPSFIGGSAQLCLIPADNQFRLRLVLQKRIPAIELHLRGYRDFRIDAFDPAKHSVAVPINRQHRRERPQKAPEEIIRVDTARAQQLVVSSSSAFLLGCIRLFPYQDSCGETLANPQKRKS